VSAGPLYGAVEGGGTKFVCAVGRSPTKLLDQVRISTGAPDETLGQVVEFFRKHPVDSLGVGMFGPLDLAAGATLRTPKPGWDDVPVRAILEAGLGVPVALDTDVNAAALGEQRLGAAQGADPCLYVTVGTGVGAGVLVGGRPLHGLLHPEFGHILLPVLPLADGTPDPFEGACPFHGRCLEGLVSGPAIAARTGRPGEDLPDDDPVWDLVGRYLGAGLAPAVLLLSPVRIVVGGSVSGRPGLLPRVRRSLAESLGGYLNHDALGDGIDEYVVPPGLGAGAGIAGALLLAQTALGSATSPVDDPPTV